MRFRDFLSVFSKFNKLVVKLDGREIYSGLRGNVPFAYTDFYIYNIEVFVKGSASVVVVEVCPHGVT